MQDLSRLVILFVAGVNLAGLHRVTPLEAALAAAVLAIVLVLRGFGLMVPGERRLAWRRAMLPHRAALTKRYRQLIRTNAYGFEEHDKWLDELARFRRSIGLELDGTHGDSFDRQATRAVEAWVRRDDGASPAADLDQFSPTDYEHHCADVLRSAGWDAEVTGMSGDQGVDVLATTDGRTVALQCKLHFASPVGNKAVQEAHAAAGFVDATHAAVVSNADYTRSAVQLARKLGVLLLHHSELPDLDRLVAGDAVRGASRSMAS